MAHTWRGSDSSGLPPPPNTYKVSSLFPSPTTTTTMGAKKCQDVVSISVHSVMAQAGFNNWCSCSRCQKEKGVNNLCHQSPLPPSKISGCAPAPPWDTPILKLSDANNCNMLGNCFYAFLELQLLFVSLPKNYAFHLFPIIQSLLLRYFYCTADNMEKVQI